MANCVTCRCGSNNWLHTGGGAICPVCRDDPLVPGTAHPRWKAQNRARFARKFGVIAPDDAVVLRWYIAGCPGDPQKGES